MASVPNDYVYLDYAATAPLCEEAAEAMAPYQVPGRANLAVGGNANSLHGPGRAAFAALEEARRSIARDLGARRPDEIVFTSGATEADDAALLEHAGLPVYLTLGDKENLKLTTPADMAFVEAILTLRREKEALA